MNNFENCGYYIDNECTICGMGMDGEDTFCKYCKDNPNCYYKQLAELKAENDKLRNCLQDIKAIATECTTCGNCSNCKYDEDCYTDEAQALGVCRMILEVITKAESEG